MDRYSLHSAKPRPPGPILRNRRCATSPNYLYNKHLIQIDPPAKKQKKTKHIAAKIVYYYRSKYPKGIRKNGDAVPADMFARGGM